MFIPDRSIPPISFTPRTYPNFYILLCIPNDVFLRSREIVDNGKHDFNKDRVDNEPYNGVHHHR